ncbi:NDR1/HIN1-like protein 1 [Cornus florida]|uniref:NDR1/HIN1-like protein 1 n=1 Tax=Cornus florida TaxID=4283 RepID=UPI00289AB48D|nr:NDR1/HIN1-like protein 1 [Cornus florida]
MTGKEYCSHHKDRRRRQVRRACACLLIFNFIVLLLILLVWAILQPKNPRFVLQDATVYAFNVSSNTFLTTNFQVTISSRNPNDKIGIYYDRLHVYATYRSQQITYYTSIPPTYQGHKDVNVWSPFIFGNNVPVAPYNGISLTSDAAAGAVSLTIKIDGRVRWKVGTFTSGRYHLHVRCPTYIPFAGPRTTGVVIGNAIKYQLTQRCRVNV